MSATAAYLSGGRLHLSHGPIDLVIGCDEASRAQAFTAARKRFEGLLDELVGELPVLRAPCGPDTLVKGATARRMVAATRAHAPSFATPMAAVAGAVAETVLDAMRAAATLSRAYVNNGGDIALHLAPGASFSIAISDHVGTRMGRIEITGRDGIGGIATSGRHGRSHSLGIADSVTVLARDAAQADVAATLIANTVDLPGHPAITRTPASALSPDSDLGDRLVTTGCGPLSPCDIDRALDAGTASAEAMRETGLIRAAALFLSGQSRMVGPAMTTTTRSLAHA